MSVLSRLVAAPLAVAALVSIASAQDGRTPFRFEPGDRVCLLGNALAERMQHHGWLEATLQTRFPELELSFRNLGFSGDEVSVQQRTSGFGTWDDYLTLNEADVVFAFFGFVESFGGDAGLAPFRSDLEGFVDHTLAQRYNGTSAPRIVLFSSIPFEDLGDPSLPDGAERNVRIRRYNEVIAAVARDKGVAFVDLYPGLLRPFAPLTINGIHLTERGNRALAWVVERHLFADNRPNDPELVERTRALVQEKNLLWFNRYRATDGFNVYGGRSNLRYTESITSGGNRYADGVSNYEVLQRELHVLDAMADDFDRRIQAAARGELPDSVAGSRLPPLIPVITNKPGAGPDGEHEFLGGDEAVSRMTPADGMDVRLFASEEDFPDLVNPVQMAWDTRGRLWVAVWPTYPHWTPGEPMNDKLLILEDQDGDGRADVAKTFAGDLHNPTGFEFWNNGVIVANCPDLLFLEDTDGDDVYDHRERLLHGLSSADTHHSANSFVLGPDGALYFQEGTFHQSQIETIFGPMRNHNGCVWRFEPRTWRVDRYIPYGFANPHGHVFDRWGQDFMTDGTGNVNYYSLPFSGHLDFPASHRGYFPFFQQRSRPCGGTEILSSRHFPPANQGNYLVANVIGFQGIFQYEVVDDGSGFGAVEQDPIVFSSDKNFRPVDIEVGPDGAIYLLDWQNPLIGHMQHHLRDPSRDKDHGRVYRVTWRDRELLEPIPIAGRPIVELVELLAEPEDRVRYRTRIELSGRPTDDVVAAARAWASEREDEHDLLEALWLQQQHDVLDTELLDRLIASDDHRVRAACTRVVRYQRHHLDDALERLVALAGDEHPRVRLEAVVALSHFDDPAAAEGALAVLDDEMDRFLEYALGETLRALEPHWRRALASGEPFAADAPAGLAHLLARLTTEELAGAFPCEALYVEQLGRHGLSREQYATALDGLARLRYRSATEELVAAIERADARTGGHTDHLLMGLFDAAGALSAEQRAELAAPLRTLATEGRRASTRRLATAARIEAEGSVDAVWNEAATSLGGLGDLLDAAPLVDEPAICEAIFPRALALLDGPPAGLVDASAATGTRGRYVRIELAGAKRTLTLAEVEVLHNGENLARRGTATQSTVNWGGAPERALDGATSGLWGDGGQTHTSEDQPNPWWELDLRSEHGIDEIVIWNRTDGDLGRRLDGFVLRVLDTDRRTVYQHRHGDATFERTTLDLSDPALRVRRAAARAVASLGVREADAVRALVVRFDDADLRPAVVEGVRGIPYERWPDEAPDMLGVTLLAHFTSRPATEFESDTGRELLALADELSPHLRAELATLLHDARRRLGPQVVVIRPVPDALLYDRVEFTVVAGHPVELLFDNVDIMPHNLIVTSPGALAKVGMAAEDMAAEPDAWSRAFVPDLDEVLQATGLLQPGQSETLRFDAPQTAADYPYVCTFPGHWVRMNGVMHVVASWDDVAPTPAAAAVEDTDAAPTRSFVRNWSVADLRPHLAKVIDRPTANGPAVLEAASCLRCHAIDGEGGRTGPDLREAVARHPETEDLLSQLVDPSATILEGYGSEIFITHDGEIISGRIVGAEEGLLLVHDDPYRDDVLELPTDAIQSRRTSTISMMPEGLLSTFERAEILDLLAFLRSLAPADDPSDDSGEQGR